MNVEWKPVPGHPGLEASSEGRLRSNRIGGRWREVGMQIDGAGYHQLGQRPKPIRVHVLVALAFHGPRPNGALVRHLNGIKTDNRPENLAWGTDRENVADALRLGEIKRGPASPNWKDTCTNGHPRTPEHLYFPPKGGRQCRTCKMERDKRKPVGGINAADYTPLRSE